MADTAPHLSPLKSAPSIRVPKALRDNPAVITVKDVPLPAFPAPATAPPVHKPALTTPMPDSTAEESAIPLPQRDEPLVRPEYPFPDKAIPLPRHRALAPINGGLLGALNNWLRSTGQSLLHGFMVKTSRRKPETAAPLRERVELTQLRAENRRLRQQLEEMAQQGAGASPIRALSDAPPTP